MEKIEVSDYSFESIRKKQSLYVDKTAYIPKLLEAGTALFFSRPRRFGKSLLLSTLKAYFEGRYELFDGLDISRIERQWKTYPVIHLDMADGASSLGFDKALEKLSLVVKRAAHYHGIDLEPNSPDIMLSTLIDTLYQKKGKVVVLIDEYDKPILSALHDVEYQRKMLPFMQDFYQVLKSNIDKEHFVFVTGVTKFAHTSLFSGANNLTDLSRYTEFANMLGYTEMELQDNFGAYIEQLAGLFCKTIPEIREEIKNWYNGSRFADVRETLYNPVSVGCLFKEKKFKNYWFTTGTPSFLVSLMKKNPFGLDRYLGKWYGMDDFQKHETSQFDVLELAVQTGYLTISEYESDTTGVSCKYDFPNYEIKQSWYSLMLPLAFNDSSNIQDERMSMVRALKNADVDTLMNCMKHTFAGASYENIGSFQINEGYYRNMMYMLFTSFGMHLRLEDHNSVGRIDFVAQDSKYAYVFELKVISGETETEEKLAEALSQSDSRFYAEKYKVASENVMVIAVVFDRKTRQLVNWKVGRA